MSVPAEFAKQFAAFPECLRKLVEAELADGNSIVEISGGFPAAPCGDCLKLAKPVAACRRDSRDGVDFYERNRSDYFGEFTHDKRHFFVLEPPKPPEPEPDMNAVRAALEAKQLAAEAERFAMEQAALTEARCRARDEGAGTDATAREFFASKPGRFSTSAQGPQEAWPNMDAIRAEMEAKQRAADTDRFGQEDLEREIARHAASKKEPKPQRALSSKTEWKPQGPLSPLSPMSTVGRFMASVEGSFEHWHDGTGYDIARLKSATPDELAQIESFLLSRGVRDWRDVEALAAIDSASARKRLRAALKGDDHRIAIAVAEYAPDLVSDAERTRALVAALEGSEIYGGLTQALLEVEEFHPPKVIAALFRGLLTRTGVNAVNFAGMLMFLHGKAESSFDWNHRPLFLRFNTEDRAERESAFRELCEKIGVNPEKYLKPAKPGGAKRPPRKSK